MFIILLIVFSILHKILPAQAATKPPPFYSLSPTKSTKRKRKKTPFSLPLTDPLKKPHLHSIIHPFPNRDLLQIQIGAQALDFAEQLLAQNRVLQPL